MSLPPYSPSVYWKDYEIDTPTFRLTPIEKPDMSPFLVHMTGPSEILSILRGEGAPNQVPEQHGYIRANIPEHAENRSFQAPVVCFTESPTFALDFFRYRSFRRWENDQRFGIGFDKEYLVNEGIRPVIYLEDDLVEKIIRLYYHITNKSYQPLADDELNSIFRETILRVYPLLFPLLKDLPDQGFMWEREWRYPNPNGYVFPYEAIRIICCPEEEEDNIREILGHHISHIRFIRTWQEYDDITDYIERQQKVWYSREQRIIEYEREDERILEQRNLLHKYKMVLNTMDSYEEFIVMLQNKLKQINQKKQEIYSKISKLENEIKEVEENQNNE